MARKKNAYRLETLLKIKESEKKAAELHMAHAQQHLRQEELRLKKREEELETCRENIRNLREEWKEKALSGQMTIGDVQNHGNFEKRLQDLEEEAQNNLLRQQQAVLDAENAVVQARARYLEAYTELRKLEKHKENWENDLRAEQVKKDASESEEIGNIIHNYR